jgi:hypothetical protein
MKPAEGARISSPFFACGGGRGGLGREASHGSNEAPPDAFTIMAAAQEQHRSILDAIRHREGERAEALACERSRSTRKYLRMALNADPNQIKFPGFSLVRRTANRSCAAGHRADHEEFAARV